MIAAVWLREPLESVRKIGFALILAGALVIVFAQGIAWTGARSLGHVLFLSTSFLWACAFIC